MMADLAMTTDLARTADLARTPIRPVRCVVAALLLLTAVLASPAAADETVPFGEGLLWRIERDGVVPSYLFGTMHVTDPRVLNLPAPVADVLDHADSLTIEVVMSPLDMVRLSLAMFLTDGRTLESIVGADTFAAIVAAAAPYGMPESALSVMRPWGATLVLSSPPEEFRRTAAGERALDLVLEDRMRALGRPVYGLETVDEQIAILNDQPEDRQVAMLRQAVISHPKIEVMFARLLQAYQARNVYRFLAESMEQTTGEDRALTEAFLEIAVNARNQRMVDRMADRLAEGNALIAIGALHLPGERGALTLLASQGWRITREY